MKNIESNSNDRLGAIGDLQKDIGLLKESVKSIESSSNERFGAMEKQADDNKKALDDIKKALDEIKKALTSKDRILQT